MNNILELALRVLSGLVVVIPLVVKLIEYVKVSVRAKNWEDVLQLVMNLMAVAETKFKTGQERKDWVMLSIKASADTIDYDIDLNQISQLIDDLCAMTKKVNAEIMEETSK